MTNIRKLQDDIVSLQQAVIDMQRMLIVLHDQFDRLENDVRRYAVNPQMRSPQ